MHGAAGARLVCEGFEALYLLILSWACLGGGGSQEG